MADIKISSTDFGRIAVGKSRSKTVALENVGLQRVDVASLTSDNGNFVPDSDAVYLEPNFPASSDIFYWDDAKTIQNANGEFAPTNQGYGKAGTTNANRRFLPHFVDLQITITAPVASTEFALDTAFDVEGTSTGTAVIIEAQNDSAVWTDITVAGGDVTVTAGNFSASCKFLESDGFSAGSPYTIRVKDSINSAIFDTVDVATESDAQGLLILDATCLASTPETLENIVETQTLDATCSASTPTSI